MKNNPYNLKQVDEIPAGYLDADEFLRIASNGEVSINEGSLDTAGIIFKVSGLKLLTTFRASIEFRPIPISNL